MAHPRVQVPTKHPFSTGSRSRFLKQKDQDQDQDEDRVEDLGLRMQLTNVLHDYLQSPCIHGVSYLADPNLSVPARVFWRLVMLVCVVGLLVVGWGAILADDTGSLNRETITTVEDTQVNVQGMFFPSLTICPVSKIKKSVAFSLFKRHALVPTFNSSDEQLLEKLMLSLQNFRYPWYSASSMPDMNRIKFGLLGAFNVTYFMEKVMPTCNEMMGWCFFNDIPFDCCSEFHLQETHFGFCYSFNSCVSVDNKTRKGCRPRRTGTKENFSLVVQVKQLDPSESVSPHPKHMGYYVVASNPFDFPQPLEGTFIDPHVQANMIIRVTASVQRVDEELQYVPPAMRKCRLTRNSFLETLPGALPESMPVLPLSYIYTEVACVETCRARFMAELCGCLPYYFTPHPLFDLARYPTCNIYDIECVSKNILLLSYARDGFYRGEQRRYLKDMEGISVRRNSCDCLPNCDFMFYDSVTDSTGGKSGNSTAGVVQLQLKSRGKGIGFRMRARRSLSEHIGIWGNIASLFLGISVLSVVEFFYTVGVGVSILIRKARSRTTSIH